MKRKPNELDLKKQKNILKIDYYICSTKSWNVLNQTTKKYWHIDVSVGLILCLLQVTSWPLRPDHPRMELTSVKSSCSFTPHITPLTSWGCVCWGEVRLHISQMFQCSKTSPSNQVLAWSHNQSFRPNGFYLMLVIAFRKPLSMNSMPLTSSLSYCICLFILFASC